MLPDEPKSRRALMREAATTTRRLGLNLTPAEVRLAVSGYQSSVDRDSFSLSRWLEVRCFDPTARTAVERVQTSDPSGSKQRARFQAAVEIGDA